LPYPLRPLNILKGCSGLRCTNRDSIAIFPQVSWEFGCVSPPTDFTDLHRWLGCVCAPTEFTDLHRWLGCVCAPTEFTEFTEVLLRLFSHRIHGIHRSFVASHSSINLESVLWEGLLCQKVLCVLCVLWEVFLCQKVPCVLCVLWEYSLPRILQINTDGWLRWFSHGIHGIHRSFVALVLPQNSRNSQKFYCVAFFYKLRECSVEGASLPEGSVCSVCSVGI